MARARGAQRLFVSGIRIVGLWVKVTSSVGENLRINICNITGQSVLKQDMASSLESVDISRLPAGNYLLRVAGERRSYAFPFVRTE